MMVIGSGDDTEVMGVVTAMVMMMLWNSRVRCFAACADAATCVQASSGCFILFMAYVLQVNCNPFVVLDETTLVADAPHPAGHRSWLDRARAYLTTSRQRVVSHNQLESIFLISSVLLWEYFSPG